MGYTHVEDVYKRQVVTRGKTNAVYVLDQKLKLTGKITNLAKDERVYSARFLGDTGYFVTYKETDPLFSVDLSNPKNPKILGRLKIPGFSNYLHFYGEDTVSYTHLQIKYIKEQAQKSSYEGIELILESLEKAKTRLKANVNFDLVMELLFLTIKEN